MDKSEEPSGKFNIAGSDAAKELPSQQYNLKCIARCSCYWLIWRKSGRCLFRIGRWYWGSWLPCPRGFRLGVSRVYTVGLTRPPHEIFGTRSGLLIPSPLGMLWRGCLSCVWRGKLKQKSLTSPAFHATLHLNLFNMSFFMREVLQMLRRSHTIINTSSNTFWWWRLSRA